MWTASLRQSPIARVDWPAIINRAVNNSIVHLPGFPAVDAAGRYWPNEGWCIDFAWTKRQELLLRGFAESELLLTEVSLRNNGGRHMVLNVNGMILDSINRVIVPLDRMPYKVVLTQSSSNPGVWLTEDP